MSFRDYGDDSSGPADLTLLKEVAYRRKLERIQQEPSYKLIRELSEQERDNVLLREISRLEGELEAYRRNIQLLGDTIFWKKHLAKGRGLL
jgi:hypothetical protein